jgi:hypothetical protein
VSPELRFLVAQRIKAGSLTLDELRNWVLLETAQWRSKDARAAVLELYNDKHLLYEPAGRLNGATRLSWIS